MRKPRDDGGDASKRRGSFRIVSTADFLRHRPRRDRIVPKGAYTAVEALVSLHMDHYQHGKLLAVRTYSRTWNRSRHWVEARIAEFQADPVYRNYGPFMGHSGGQPWATQERTQPQQSRRVDSHRGPANGPVVGPRMGQPWAGTQKGQEKTLLKRDRHPGAASARPPGSGGANNHSATRTARPPDVPFDHDQYVKDGRAAELDVREREIALARLKAREDRTYSVYEIEAEMRTTAP